MSKRAFIIIISAVFLIVLIAGYIGVTYNSSNQPAADLNAQTARDSVISYIRENYPVTENFTSNLSWTGGRQNASSPDTEYYVYNATDWYMLLNCSAVANPVYVVDANYARGDVTIEWMGFCQNCTVIEQGYIVYPIDDFQKPPVQQAQLDAFCYFVDNHSEVSQYFNFAGWQGARITPEGLCGAETYSYTGMMYNATAIYPTGWVMTVQYPVVPNPIYSVNITYTPSGTTQRIIDWQGTCQNGTVAETLYSFTP
jgi:hypothetical protein